MPRDTVRLTVAQAIVTYLSRQYSVADGQRRRLVPAALGIFGHGNVAGLGQALDQLSDAAAGGARVLTGGQRDGATVAPTVVADVDPASPFSQNELFGPAVAVGTAEDWETAIAQANSTGYGLAAGIFTGDVAGAVQAMREIDAGSIHINWTPLWRADLMPYGGLKGSGIGKEGPRAAVAEMTESKTIVLHGRPW